MQDQRTQKAKAVVSAVNEVLYNEWAPIPADGLPLDEYESYAIEIVSFLACGTDSADLAAYLCGTFEHITGNTTDAKAVEPIVIRLLTFRDAACAIGL